MARRQFASLVLLALVLGGCGGDDGPATGGTPTATPAATGRRLAEPLDTELERSTGAAGLQGAASALVVDGKLVWSGGAGMADEVCIRVLSSP